VPIHAYDALVLPALLGVTVDEAMFLVHGLRRGSLAEALEREGPSVAATALSTAAGFGALLACRFEGPVHLGVLGAVGSLVGLGAALFVVPVAFRGLRVTSR
jgi:predicted RND superfamily exporter protein